MNKSLLNQVLLFHNESPQHARIKKLYALALEWQNINGCFFIESKRGSRATIYDINRFFEFVSESILDGKTVTSFEEIRDILNVNSRQEAIETSGDSKNSIIKVFGSVVIYQIGNENPVLYRTYHEIKSKGKILAVENGETFLNIYPTMSKFGFNEFVYLGGMSNTATRNFLQDKEVVFFLDYDIEAIRIYDSFKCKSKKFFRHPKIEQLFGNKKIINEKLYRKQLKNMPSDHDELGWLLKLIRNHSAVLEQEVFNDTY